MNSVRNTVNNAVNAQFTGAEKRRGRKEDRCFTDFG